MITQTHLLHSTVKKKARMKSHANFSILTTPQNKHGERANVQYCSTPGTECLLCCCCNHDEQAPDLLHKQKDGSCLVTHHLMTATASADRFGKVTLPLFIKKFLQLERWNF